MRGLLIQYVLPLIFCLVPPLATLLIVFAAPDVAREFYINRLSESPIDWIILGLGIPLFVVQLILSWRALQWEGTGFNERPDRWLTHLAQASEWFPMLGLIGTVMGILQTFSVLSQIATPTAKQIIESYAPAITATGSGLVMALINLFPTWVVLLGRDLIVTLAGGTPPSKGEARP